MVAPGLRGSMYASASERVISSMNLRLLSS